MGGFLYKRIGLGGVCPTGKPCCNLYKAWDGTNTLCRTPPGLPSVKLYPAGADGFIIYKKAPRYEEILQTGPTFYGCAAPAQWTEPPMFLMDANLDMCKAQCNQQECAGFLYKRIGLGGVCPTGKPCCNLYKAWDGTNTLCKTPPGLPSVKLYPAGADGFIIYKKELIASRRRLVDPVGVFHSDVLVKKQSRLMAREEQKNQNAPLQD